MNKIDYLSLDGNSLHLFATVLETLSVTKSAERLGVTQSAVSHALDKLRVALDDPLFVRSGRGIVPTERALMLRSPVEDILERLKTLTDSRQFDPTTDKIDFTIAANDFTRSLIFPKITKSIYDQSINARFTFLPAHVPDPAMLRQNRCDFLLTPFPPDGNDIYQVRLFSDSIKCFYDAQIRKPPSSKNELLSANHIDVIFEDHGSVMNSLFAGFDLAAYPKPKICVPSFDAVTEFIFGTDLVTIQAGRMHETTLKNLDCADLPFRARKLTIYLVWHRRSHYDPAHIWMRSLIKNAVSG
jgi:DNA-binding transcriptional LysR family regulator